MVFNKNQTNALGQISASQSQALTEIPRIFSKYPVWANSLHLVQSGDLESPHGWPHSSSQSEQLTKLITMFAFCNFDFLVLIHIQNIEWKYQKSVYLILSSIFFNFCVSGPVISGSLALTGLAGHNCRPASSSGLQHVHNDLLIGWVSNITFSFEILSLNAELFPPQKI